MFWKKVQVSASTEYSVSCEEPEVSYMDFPDGLRLVFRDKKYIGYYTTTLNEVLS